MRSSSALVCMMLGVIGGACGGEDSPMEPDDGTPCNLTISAFTLPADDPGPFSVEYDAQVVSGTGAITQITYLDGVGASQTVTNPTLPWSMSLSVDPGNDVSMSSQGSSSPGGRVEISFTAVNAESQTYSMTRFCEP